MVIGVKEALSQDLIISVRLSFIIYRKRKIDRIEKDPLRHHITVISSYFALRSKLTVGDLPEDERVRGQAT